MLKPTHARPLALPLTRAGLALAALALAGCTNHGPGATTTGAGTATTAPTSTKALAVAEPQEPKADMPSAPAKKPYKIGVSLYTQDDPFYIALKKGLEDEGATQKVTLDIVSADKDANKQVNQVQNFIAQKEDAIVVCPVDSSSFADIQAANAAGIPVFTADIAAKGGKVTSYIASDNVQGGTLVGDYVGKTLLAGKGSVAVLDQSTVSSVVDRVKGFKAALAKYPGIKIVADEDVADGKRENAVPKATNLLTAHPEINAFFGINDPVALGAQSALQQANNKTVSVVGFDAVPEAQNYIQTGTNPLKADAIQYPHLIGVLTVDTIVKSLNGEPVPPVVHVPTGLVTKDSFK